MAGYIVKIEKKLPPRAIRCPKCNARHYTVRQETRQYVEEKLFTVICDCGCKYQVINKGLYSIIRRRERDDARLQSIV